MVRSLLQFVVRRVCLLFVVCNCLLLVVSLVRRCSLLFVRCALFAVCSLMFVVRCRLLLFVVCG